MDPTLAHPHGAGLYDVYMALIHAAYGIALAWLAYRQHKDGQVTRKIDKQTNGH